MVENHETLIGTNAQLRKDLGNIQTMIEQTLQIKRGYSNSNRKDEGDENEDGLTNAIQFNDTVDKFKFLIEEVTNKLTIGFNFRQIVKKENEIKVLKEYLERLQSECTTLMKINQRQDKTITAIENKYDNNVERSIMNEKVKNLKEEWKIMKEYNKGIVNKMKIQQKGIDELNKYCDLIKENMKRRKEMNSSERSNSQKDIQAIETLQHKLLSQEESIRSEQLSYVIESKKQKEQREVIDKEIDVLRIKIKQKDQEIRINQLKLKELNKLASAMNNNHNNSINNISITSPSVKNGSNQSRIRIDSGKRLQAKINNAPYSMIKNKNKRLYVRGFSALNKSKSNINSNHMRSITNVTAKINNKGGVMSDIETLKNEIQYALNDIKGDMSQINYEEKRRVIVKQKENNFIDNNEDLGKKTILKKEKKIKPTYEYYHKKANLDYLDNSEPIAKESGKSNNEYNDSANQRNYNNEFVMKKMDNSNSNNDYNMPKKEAYNYNENTNNNKPMEPLFIEENQQIQQDSQPVITEFKSRRKPFQISNFTKKE